MFPTASFGNFTPATNGNRAPPVVQSAVTRPSRSSRGSSSIAEIVRRLDRLEERLKTQSDDTQELRASLEEIRSSQQVTQQSRANQRRTRYPALNVRYRYITDNQNLPYLCYFYRDF